MVNTAYLASTLVMGLLGVGVVVLVLRVRRWQQYTPRVAYDDIDAGGGRPTTGLARMAGQTNTWTVAYVLLVLGFLLGAVVYSSGAVTGMTMIAAVGGLIAVYLVGGIYFAMREHGRPSAQAAAGSAVATGMLSVLAITVTLLVS